MGRQEVITFWVREVLSICSTEISVGYFIGFESNWNWFKSPTRGWNIGCSSLLFNKCKRNIMSQHAKSMVLHCCKNNQSIYSQKQLFTFVHSRQCYIFQVPSIPLYGYGNTCLFWQTSLSTSDKWALSSWSSFLPFWHRRTILISAAPSNAFWTYKEEIQNCSKTLSEQHRYCWKRLSWWKQRILA